LIGEITASSNEQRDGIGQVNQAVSNLDQMTQQNAALVEESAAAASSLRDQAQRLAEVVSVFNVGYQPAATPPAPRPPAPRAAAPSLAPPAPKPAGAAIPKAPPAPKPAKQAPKAASSKGSDEDWESF
ncbi:MAG: methyl-accepting chemotaxis protein, partial [Gammaproteobacteria bacterium]|nr:methyl-accepting chemotaxis protein [Gammaproteobacteria bacterium]